MKPKKSFQALKPWLRGGLRGIVVCIALGLFYVGIYFPLAALFKVGDVALLLPLLITGHFFVVMSQWIIPHGLFCAKQEHLCLQWSTYETPGSIPWPNPEGGVAGYCSDLITTPTGSCGALSDALGFFTLALLLLLIYFALGAAIAQYIHRKKAIPPTQD